MKEITGIPIGLLDARYQGLDATLTSIAALADAAGVLTNNGAGVLSWAAVSAGDLFEGGTGGVVGRVAEWVTDDKHLQAANLIAPANLLTLAAGAPYTLTIPATGTAALLGTANVFTTNQKINANSTTALLVEQDGVKDNVLVADTTNGRVGINTSAPVSRLGISGLNDQLRFIYSADASKYVVMGCNQIGTLLFQSASGIVEYWDTTNSYSFRLFSAGVLKVWVKTSGSSFLNGGNVGFGTETPSTKIHAIDTTTTTNAVREVNRIEAQVSTAATGGANGFGVGQTFYAETATDATVQQQAQIAGIWVDSINATRKAKLQLSAYDTAQRIGLEIEASGTAPMIGFFGVQAVARATELTDELTTITHTAPGTPDYAIQDLTATGGFGFVTKDEGNSVLAVVANLQTRVNEIETKLVAYGLFQDAD